ncbi:2-dehydro-3-deoxy-phosphogluconate aldolase [Halopseudomonas aestusnigri]|uniref:bifunctional 4-hydroxy-2-oxoglutarate aldolase/2-dehydro-3-deoxy-phosphogluconate aldolase n=1 Tax=Halopseudomonas TaxID=2901189 RepID=UPI0022B6FDC3|nr:MULTISPECIES: bifunctional 4-hydroxy-2-oxoglutarate aldolase/2-dehydro-3-deoxy-phosphogluconate aldolase [Halopseudomonas]BDX19359.1 2-dehydro-3-deoxy-phosphogluconate aldolase [Halopseudomonas aestusnigri]
MTHLSEKTQMLDSLFSRSPLLPLLNIERLEDVLPLADALAEGGITTLEITLRTALGIDAIALLRSQRPALTVGAGTVLAAEQFEAVLAAGAQFVVTPGCTDELLQCGLEAAVPLLPGIATASELMSGYRLGYRRFKLFPAQILGGVGLLRAFAGPFRDVRFCPTGGVSQANLAEYLALPNVMAVGGSWVAPAELVAQQRWGEITALACAAGQVGSA